MEADEPEAGPPGDELTSDEANIYENVDARDKAQELIRDLRIASFRVGQGNKWSLECLKDVEAAFRNIPRDHHRFIAGFTVRLQPAPGYPTAAGLWDHDNKILYFNKNEGFDRFDKNVDDEAKERNEKTQEDLPVPGAEYLVAHEVGHGVDYGKGTPGNPYHEEFYKKFELNADGLLRCMGKLKHKDALQDRGPENMKLEVFAEAYAAWTVNSHKLPLDMAKWFDEKFGAPRYWGRRSGIRIAPSLRPA